MKTIEKGNPYVIYDILAMHRQDTINIFGMAYYELPPPMDQPIACLQFVTSVYYVTRIIQKEKVDKDFFAGGREICWRSKHIIEYDTNRV